MSEQIAVRIPDRQLAELDDAVRQGRFPSRAEAVRAALTLLLRAEREREIAGEYARAYGGRPDDEWVGRAGLELGARTIGPREGG